ncbi:hypothetical protein KO498_12475 [Lentibacter algarum]|uniref:hypothetical protein n=1 Tax=Lentibacter algarum TaxID=576131 RepID=UPI001C085F22|nr:hypothetical protein [Lentibacter algarum]MBU2982625.1 hypothetical protein [Lentibacter algarum]
MSFPFKHNRPACLGSARTAPHGAGAFGGGLTKYPAPVAVIPDCLTESRPMRFGHCPDKGQAHD